MSKPAGIKKRNAATAIMRRVLLCASVSALAPQSVRHASALASPPQSSIRAVLGGAGTALFGEEEVVDAVRERETESNYFCLRAPRTRTADAVNLHPRAQAYPPC